MEMKFIMLYAAIITYSKWSGLVSVQDKLSLKIIIKRPEKKTKKHKLNIELDNTKIYFFKIIFKAMQIKD